MENEIQELSNDTAVSSQSVETRVDNGNETKNGEQNRSQALQAAREALLGKPKIEVQEKTEAKVDDDTGTGEESRVEGEVPKVDSKKAQLPEDVQKIRKHDKQQISKLVAQKHALKEEVAKWKTLANKLNSQSANEPKPEDFEGDINAYNRAKIKYDMDMERDITQYKEAEYRVKEQKNTEFTERCKATVKDFDTFSSYYNANKEWLDSQPEILKFAHSLAGPRILEDAFIDFQNPEVVKRWNALSSEGRIHFLANAERRIINELEGNKNEATQASQPQKSKAPAPITPEKVSEQMAGKSGNRAEMLARERQRLLGR